MPFPLHDTNEYIHEVLSYVRLRRDHKKIWQGLLNHFEDSREQGKAEGLTEEAAERRSIERMGDPAALGKALDREHNIQLWHGVIISLACVIFTLWTLIQAFPDYRNRFDNVQDTGHVLFDIEIDESVQLGALTLTFDRLVINDNNEGFLYYTGRMTNPFETVPVELAFDIADDTGHVYRDGILAIVNHGLEHYCLPIEAPSPFAKRLYLTCDRYGRYFRIEVPLRGE